MPEEKSVRNWYEITPDDFIFSIKGYRFFTHQKKLITDDIFTERLLQFERLAGLLKKKTGPFLWQFPANFSVNLNRLEKFCSMLSTAFHHVFEFRNETWFIPEVYDILQKFNHDLCIVSAPSSVPGIIKKISGVAYIRFHGESEWYRSNYNDETLRTWKNELSGTGANYLFAYFNNDANAYAVNNGKYFASLFKQ